MQPFPLFLMLILASCSAHPDNQPKEISDTIAMQKSKEELLHHDTLVQNGVSLVRIRKGNQVRGLFTMSGDTILKEADYYDSISFPDVDEDGYKDIRVIVFSNTPNQSENYFFDKQSGRFKRIENSDLDIKKVEGVNLFYSYNSTGCADMNWESHLSKIENWKEVNIGRINAKGCGDKEDGIYIYKVQDRKEKIFEKSRIDSVLKESKGKWAFIKKYWAKNYKKFLQ
jgi:hypothetical protein